MNAVSACGLGMLINLAKRQLVLHAYRVERVRALAVNDYAHSTAPNRRFVDLVTQRLVKATLSQRAMPYSMDELDAVAQHCTVQEDSASTVERRVDRLRRLEPVGPEALRFGEVRDFPLVDLLDRSRRQRPCLPDRPLHRPCRAG